MIRIPVIAILICLITFLSNAQDTTKKKGLVKPYTKDKTAQTPVVKPTVPVKPAAQPTALAKQDTAKAEPVNTDKSLNGQYRYVLTKIYHYQGPFIESLWKSATDTLNLNKRKLRETTGRLVAQTKIIDSLKAEVVSKDQTITASNAHVNAINLLGVAIDKSLYNLIMWGLVLVFGATAIVVIARSGSYSREAKYRTALYNELEEDYKTFKAKANEKEKKLARELQTERNKLDELLGNG